MEKKIRGPGGALGGSGGGPGEVRGVPGGIFGSVLEDLEGIFGDLGDISFLGIFFCSYDTVCLHCSPYSNPFSGSYRSICRTAFQQKIIKQPSLGEEFGR